MTDIAEITITKVSNGWTVKWIGDVGTDEAIARDVDELCSVLRDVLGGEGSDDSPFKFTPPPTPGEIQNEALAIARGTPAPTTPPAFKTEGPISMGEPFRCPRCRYRGHWSENCHGRSQGCPFTPAAPGKQAQ